MTIELKLDTHALNELFKDEPARVQLQQAVIENFMSRHIKSMVNGISNDPAILKAIREAQEEATEKFFTVKKTKTNSYPFSKIEYSAKQEVLDQLTLGLEDHLKKTADAMVQKSMQSIDERIRQKVALAVSAAINNYTTAQVQQKVSDAVKTFEKQLMDNIKFTG